jgi:hypothetical protein
LEAELGAFFTRNLENDVVNRVPKASWADREALGADLLKPLVVNAYAYLASMHSQGMGITPKQAVRSKTYILRVVKWLQYHRTEPLRGQPR